MSRYGATPRLTGSSLCSSCRESFIAEDDQGQETRICRANHYLVLITRNVVRCNEYQERSATSKWDMEKIAWIVQTNEKREFVGFQKPKPEDE